MAVELFKKLFKKKAPKKMTETEVEEVLKPTFADGIFPAKQEHLEFIFQEVVNGAGSGSYHPALYERYAHIGLREQISDSINSKYFNARTNDKIRKTAAEIKVIYHGGEVSGFYWSTNPSENLFEVYMLSVREKSKRTGLGKRLVQAALSSYPKGSKTIARVYENQFKIDRSNAMQKILIGEGFEKPLKQLSTHTTQFEKIIS